VVVGASAVAAIAAGLRWHRPARRLPWCLIAAAQGLFVAGDALFSVNDLVLGIEPFPSLADALYLPGYPVLAAGLALLAHSRSTGRDWAGLTDAAAGLAGLPGRGTCSCWPWRPGWPPPRAGARSPTGC
jgi:diguanylate cyclase